MKKITSIIMLLCVHICFVQCKEKIEVETYEVTPEFAKKIDKPEVHFIVDIPKNLKFDKPVEGKKTYSYGMIQEVGEDSVTREMCSFGYIKMEGNMSLKKDGGSFMDQILQMLKSGGYKIEEKNIGVQEFDGKEYMTLRAIGTMKEGISKEFVGRYFFNVVAKPNPYGDTNIIMLMAAREDQVKTYEDFKDKLTISTVWNSFKYLK
ncbi:hypothetical protein [uncultured Kordia sp.]|uniref:hypothetical protein n=1 Tax=uncultured Kordia sp. TaxID=507699 RepID=UPI002621C2D4|nr:hypothetical protein [uncultured Kordia sp.]